MDIFSDQASFVSFLAKIEADRIPAVGSVAGKKSLKLLDLQWLFYL
jgi:hypothetical protein